MTVTWVLERGVFASGDDALAAAIAAAGDRLVAWQDEWWSDGRWPRLDGLVFVWPDSPLKPFAGRVVVTKDLSLPAPERVYVLDLCRTGGALRLLELNPSSGADLYAADPASVDAVARSEAAGPLAS